MSKFYNKYFLIGFCTNILMFVVLNIIDYFVATNKYDPNRVLSHDTGPTWGVPFSMFGVFYIGFSSTALYLNIFIVILLSFIMGLIFKSVWSKLKVRSLR